MWAIKHFKKYVYGVKIKVVSDYKALMSVLEPVRGNETFSSSFMSWVDKLLPFDFEVIHTPGRT